jgi:hypothetical protein
MVGLKNESDTAASEFSALPLAHRGGVRTVEPDGAAIGPVEQSKLM